MARIKREDKRGAILGAATRLIAERGPAATPTSEISRAAGISEGALFTYFKTKADLVNAVFRAATQELVVAMRTDLPYGKKPRRRLRHLWNARVQWGAANASAHLALVQIRFSNLLAGDARQDGEMPANEIRAILREIQDQGRLREGLSVEFASSAFDALAAATIKHVVAEPTAAEEVTAAAFKLFWKGLVRK